MNRFDLAAFGDKDVVFVGAGRGRAMAGVEEFLRSQTGIASFAGVDKRDGDDPLGFLKDYDQRTTIFIKNEGIPGRDMPVPYITQLQLFFELVRQTGASTVGITGTKGKSTTAALTAHILETAGKKVTLAGNIGSSPLGNLVSADADSIFVLELSSYQLSDLGASPHISAVINLYNDHADWHGSQTAYWEAKRNIVRYATSEDIFIYNPDFLELTKWAKEAACQSRPINPSESYDFDGAKLFGDHNRLNILIAREIARALGVSDEGTHQAVMSFEPLEHRMEFVANVHGLTYIDDAIGMTPESTLASLRAVSQKYGQVGCLMLGGQDRGYDFSELMLEIARYNVPYLVMFPETIQKMKAALPHGYQPDILETESMQEAVKFASNHTPTGNVVLLSTAAPSYLLWSGFEEKGDKFKQAVSELS